MRDFEILTLSDHNLGKYRGLSEPITIITGTLTLLQSIFPNLNFGGRNASQIQEDERRSMLFHQAAFLRKYNIQLSPDIVVSVLRPGWDAGENGAQLWNRIMIRFYNENRIALENSKIGGGFLTGSAPGGVFTPYGSLSAYLPFVVGGVILLILFKKRKK